MSAPEFNTVVPNASAWSQVDIENQQNQIGKTTAGHDVKALSPSADSTTAKTDKVAAETREDLVKNACTCNVDCCCCHAWVRGLPATIILTVLCFWNPIAWCCLIPAWKAECCD